MVEPTAEAITLQHDFTKSIRFGTIFEYKQKTMLHDSDQEREVGHMGAYVERCHLIIGEGADVIYVEEDYRDKGVASQMFRTFICNVWCAVPYNLRGQMQVIMRNGEDGNGKLLQWLNSLGVQDQQVTAYTRLNLSLIHI